eukprot:gene11221-biopygen6351
MIHVSALRSCIDSAQYPDTLPPSHSAGRSAQGAYDPASAAHGVPAPPPPPLPFSRGVDRPPGPAKPAVTILPCGCFPAASPPPRADTRMLAVSSSRAAL